MLRSPLRWVGGKSRLRAEILKRFPPHTCYVEVFCGAGWVLFGKEAETSKVEIINDIDGELINFYRVLKHRPAEFAEQFHLELVSRQLFNEYRRFEEGKTELERAMRFYYVMRLCFGGKREQRTFGTGTVHMPGELNLSRIYFVAHQYSGRLERVVIENLSWQKCIQIYDRPHTFFYLDPPYPSTQKGMYARMSWEQHAALAEVLHRVQGKFLLSYQDHPRIRRLYRGRGLKTERLPVTYHLGSKSGHGRRTHELLIRNF
ncbi:hypothetical protein LCGC14_2333550 [marine sediment metagenome]|uniref:site-specific DNA-methyltransferase (adenine-specific) n=1 Tax=marine sediment metagenome TaxID=412755 RepID=A0A0F9CEY9_9ZZZZ